MPVPQITALPDPPSRQDPTNFAVKGDAFLGALPDFATEANTLATQVNERVDAAFAAGLEGAATNAATTVTKAAEARASELAAADYANAAAQATTGFDTLRPKIRPALNLDFVNQEVVDRRVVVSRAGPKSYFGKRKVLGDENLLRFSEQFDNTYWSKAGVNVTANAELAPDGTLTAERIVENSSTSVHRASATLFSSATSVFLSAYVKDFGRRYVLIANTNTGTSEYAVFDLQTGTIAAQVGAISNVGIESAANGYYRIWAQLPVTVAYFHFNNVVGGPLAYTGDNTSGIIFWGAQAEIPRAGQTRPTAYTRTVDYPVRTFFNALETAAANVMPVEYDPVSQQCLGVKPESAATNLLLRSEEFDNASWSKNAASIIPNIGVAPNGALTADALIINAGQAATGAGSAVGAVTQSATVVASAPYIFSFYVKAAGASILGVRSANGGLFVSFDLSTGTVVGGAGQANFTPFITAVGGGWYRVWMITTVAGTAMGFNIKRGDVGDGYSGFLLWGVQLEASTLGVPSSYIPTTAAQVTRLADNLTVPVTDFDYNQNEGTLYIETQGLAPVDTGLGKHLVNLGSSDTTSQISIRRSDNLTATPMQHFVSNQGVTEVNANADVPTLTAGQLTRSAASFKLNSYLSYNNGAAQVNDAACTMPNNVTTLFIGQSTGGSLNLDGYIRCLRYYNAALSAAETQALSKV